MNTSTLSIDIQSQLKADLTNLNTFQVDQSLKLTELVCKFIKDPKSFDFQNKLNEFATSNERYVMFLYLYIYIFLFLFTIYIYLVDSYILMWFTYLLYIYIVFKQVFSKLLCEA